MYPFHPHFTLNARKGLRGLLTTEHGEVIFKTLRPLRAKKLWLAGEPYLHITREGVKHFFGESTEAERINLLEACKTAGEVELILKMSTAHAALKTAARERLLELGIEPALESTEARTSTRKRS